MNDTTENKELPKHITINNTGYTRTALHVELQLKFLQANDEIMRLRIENARLRGIEIARQVRDSKPADEAEEDEEQFRNWWEEFTQLETFKNYTMVESAIEFARFVITKLRAV